MRRPITKLAVTLLLLSLFAGCATVPQVRVWRPWTRHLHQGDYLPPGSVIKLEVSGSTQPLLGSEDKLQQEIGAQITELLERRGYDVAESAYAAVLKVFYETRRNDALSFSSSAYSMNLNSSFSLAEAGSSSLGVSIARTLGALWSSQTTVLKQEVKTVENYTHCLSFEVTRRGGSVLWKGESIWDDPNINILDQLVPAIQTILSDLPFDPAIIPRVPEVAETHTVNFYKLVCEDRWFSCPALPYRIRFQELTNYYIMTFPRVKWKAPRGVRDLKALAAYVDLLQTAEFALPKGSGKWNDPLKRELWSKVRLGGIYEIGPDKTISHILIDLTGEPQGYYVTKCTIVSQKEYGVFQSELAEWQQALRAYYNVYK